MGGQLRGIECDATAGGQHTEQEQMARMAHAVGAVPCACCAGDQVCAHHFYEHLHDWDPRVCGGDGVRVHCHVP
jgi:hypothetical protein